MDTARDMDTAIRKNADEIQRLQAQIRKCLAKGYRTQAKPLIKRLNEIKDRERRKKMTNFYAKKKMTKPNEPISAFLELD